MDKDFRQFKDKMVIRTGVMLLAAAVSIFVLHSFVLHGRFANAVVAVLQLLPFLDEADALNLYDRVFRQHLELVVMLAIIVEFLMMFRVYLGWFTNYFIELNRGIDSLIQEEVEEISLSSELYPLERKLNTIKHTIEKQKRDILLTEQRKNDMVMYLAHDLKTPLASAIGYLSLLRDEEGISEGLRQKYLAISLDKAERLEDLINEFFEIAKFNLSHITLQYSRINLTRLLEQLVFEFQPMLAEKGLHCRLDAAEDTMLKCDADKLQRVFDNLLRNAASYSYPESEVVISARQEGGSISIRFVNHGSPIPEEKLERIFEQFYRLDSARGTGGAGLGLAIAKQIAALHGGDISAESTEEETAFTVTLPAL